MGGFQRADRIKAVLGLVGGSEGRKHKESDGPAPIFAIGLGCFDTQTGLPSKHTKLEKLFIRKVHTRADLCRLLDLCDFIPAERLLNYSLRHGAPCPYQFRLELPSISVLIPTCSTFFLWHLSNLLACSIFLFSSRSKPIAFTPAAVTTCTIAFFRRINLFTSISEFLVLAPQGIWSAQGLLSLQRHLPTRTLFL